MARERDPVRHRQAHVPRGAARTAGALHPVRGPHAALRSARVPQVPSPVARREHHRRHAPTATVPSLLCRAKVEHQWGN